MIELEVRTRTNKAAKKAILAEWYRKQKKELPPTMIKGWEKRLKVEVEDFGVRRMKTKYGSCSIERKRILFNLELAKEPIECIECIVGHEMAHLTVRNHDRAKS